VDATSRDAFGRAEPVWVVDDIVVKPGCQKEVLDLFTSEYAPYAKARKLELVDQFLLPPIERPQDSSRILFIWRYVSLDDLWQARYGEENDDRLSAFWGKLDECIVSRTRDLGRKELMQGVSLPTEVAIPSPAAPARRRQILFVKPDAELDADAQARWVEAAGAVVGSHGITQSLAGFHGEFSYLPNSFTWDVQSEGAAPPAEIDLLGALPGPAVASECVLLGERLDAGLRDPGIGNGLKRTIFFRAGDDLSDDDLATLCKSLGDWSRHLPEIRNWTVSKVADCKGDVRWTHCSEQEFENLDAIMGPYLNHPYHWAVIDRLFHRESHSQMVYEYNHTIRPISKSILSSLS